MHTPKKWHRCRKKQKYFDIPPKKIYVCIKFVFIIALTLIF